MGFHVKKSRETKLTVAISAEQDICNMVHPRCLFLMLQERNFVTVVTGSGETPLKSVDQSHFVLTCDQAFSFFFFFLLGRGKKDA